MKRRAMSLAAAALCLLGCSGEAVPVPKQIDAIDVSLPTRRIVLYGDSRPANPGENFFMGRADPVQERALVIARIAGEKPDLIVHSGDLVGRGSRADHWKVWKDTHQAILGAGIPFHSALGNHEYAGDPEQGLANVGTQFPYRGGCRWYAVRAGPLLFAIVDTNFESLPKHFVEAQDAWFGETLRDARRDPAIKLLIVVSHHPPYTNSKVHGPSEETRRRFADTAAASPKFKMFVAGHVHNYERFLIGGVQYVVSGGGGAPQTGVRTSDFRTVPAYHGPEFRPFHYLLMEVGGDRVTVDTIMLQDDGSWESGDRFDIPW